MALEQLKQRLIEFWNSIGLWQRVLLVGIPAVLIIGAIAAITMVIGPPPENAQLYGDLELADAAAIVDELKKQNIPFELENDGRDIYVPPEYVYTTRLSLASMGLPQGHVGFEIFNESKLGITEKGMAIDYQRAVQGELSRTLESLEQVISARVLLNIAPDTSFLDTTSRSTASVALTLKSDERLNEGQVEGIRFLVSRSVSRLAPDDVSIVDERGNPLTGQENGDEYTREMLDGMALTDLQHQFRSRVERTLENKIRQVLEGPYGRGNVTPSVSVDIDFSQIRSESETYAPSIGDEGVVNTLHEYRKNETITAEDVGGIPGTTSNVPGYLGISPGEGEDTENREYNLMVDYLVNREVRMENLPPGAITQKQAAVALNTDTWDQTTKTSVESLVASAIGADPRAGDTINVQAFVFSQAEETQQLADYQRQQMKRTYMQIAGWAMAVLMVIFALLFLRGLVLAVLPRQVATPEGLEVPMEESVEEQAEKFALSRLDELEDTHGAKVRQEISRMIETDPDRVVALLRTWMLEDA